MATLDLRPRSADEQIAWQQARDGIHVVTVATDEHTGDVAGFGALSPYRDRPGYATTVEDSVYVHPDHQGRGVGKLIVGDLVERAEVHGFHVVMARIATDGIASMRAHEAVGFEVIGVERQVGRKFARWIDMALLQKIL